LGLKTKPQNQKEVLARPALAQGSVARRPQCPEQIRIIADSVEPTLTEGQPMSLVLADGRPQLVVGREVARLREMRPGIEIVARCLEEGERYAGTVSAVQGRRFEGTLSPTA
jgi:hypothetical protein